MRRPWILGLLALAVIGLAYTAAQVSCAAPQKAQPGPAVKLLTGKSVTVADFKGHPLVLNFWATWCPPCRMEVPQLQKVYDDNRAKKTTVQFLAVALDYPDAVKKFVRDQKITFPVALDEHGALGDKYRVDGIPTTYFFDSKGAVAGKFVGARAYSDFQAAIKRLK
jgi:thiol-disulfide isomerase/thioredoxin